MAWFRCLAQSSLSQAFFSLLQIYFSKAQYIESFLLTATRKKANTYLSTVANRVGLKGVCVCVHVYVCHWAKVPRKQD
ncbi:hypothetical protein M441DRAFT_219551 [Trichoderma asperellum CBS 433.97]|uniref:Secreted protein n=1 Tax=Trichoderma asperellum (strain ATCC 204424 / CBS 433.97 / NBRC 101777) TaxID=1042311 RepID=A0A2T3ZP25_TRIA4|nr:hypothetical protein M441DRAFT_219551 [Trichoderma asperellum CBS 433.97]PTB46548.1 hypothetical protein M441DRAFT_219551 [Trichoderma asperellum CBS 433.97]